MKRIFYGHDQQESPAAMMQFLQMAGYEVELFAHSDALLERTKKEKPTALLLDVLIEGRNAFEVCKLVRRQYTPEELPIAITSAIYRSRSFRDEAFHSGAQLYLLKPMKLDELAQCVQQLCDAKEPLPSPASPARS